MRERNGRRHQLGRFITGKAEHQTLIAGALLCACFAFRRGLIDTLLDVARLLAHFADHPAGVGMKNAIPVDVSNTANRIPDSLFEIKFRVARDFACKHDQVALREGFASDATQRILLETGIENVIADRIANFIGMTFGDRFRGKNVTM